MSSLGITSIVKAQWFSGDAVQSRDQEPGWGGGAWLESGLGGSDSALAETWDSVSSTMVPPLTSVSGDPALSGLRGHQAHTLCTDGQAEHYIHANQYILILRIKELEKAGETLTVWCAFL